jgi:hypothetical protein
MFNKEYLSKDGVYRDRVLLLSVTHTYVFSNCVALLEMPAGRHGDGRAADTTVTVAAAANTASALNMVVLGTTQQAGLFRFDAPNRV